MVDWPGSLPDVPDARGYSERPPNLAIRTQMDAGPDKVRRRFTAGVREYQFSMTLDGSQTEDLDDFYINTLEGGVLRFNFDDPRSGVEKEFRFVEPPSYSSIGGDNYRATIKLELLP